MPDVPLNFFWEVLKTGHRWIQTHAMGQGPDVRWTLPDPSLQPRQRALSWGCATTRSPPTQACSATSPPPIRSLDAIKIFADRFGMLGGNLRKRIVLHDQGRERQAPAWGSASIVGEWVHEILVMRLAIDLWEFARRGERRSPGAHDHLGEPEGTRVSINTHRELERGVSSGGKPTRVHRAVIAAEH